MGLKRGPPSTATAAAQTQTHTQKGEKKKKGTVSPESLVYNTLGKKQKESALVTPKSTEA